MGACPSPSSHRGQLREYSQGPQAAGIEAASGRATVADEIDVGAARRHRGLQVLAPRLRLRRRVAEQGRSSCFKTCRRAGESGVADLHDEIELTLPGLEVGPLGTGELLRRDRAARARPRRPDTGGRSGRRTPSRRPSDPRRPPPPPADPEVATEPALLDVRRLAHPLELREVVAGAGTGVGVPAAGGGDHEHEGERVTDPHARQRVSGSPERQPLKEARRPAETGRMPHGELRVVLGVARTRRARPLAPGAGRAPQMGSLARVLAPRDGRGPGSPRDQRPARSGAESVADPEVRSDAPRGRDERDARPTDQPPRPATPHLEHPHLPIQEDHRDRLSIPNVCTLRHRRKQHRLPGARRRVAPQPTHPFPPGLRDQHAPPAAGPAHLDDLHACDRTAVTATDVGRAGFEPATRGLKAPCSRPD